MSSGACNHCGKACEPYVNYCDWACHVAAVRAAGGRVICPNGLPITCVRHDGTLLEHEHADHPDYRFPVTVGFIGRREDGLAGCDTSYARQVHALVYADGDIALTMFESTYGLFSVCNGLSITGSMWKRGEWQLNPKSLIKVQRFVQG